MGAVLLEQQDYIPELDPDYLPSDEPQDEAALARARAQFVPEPLTAEAEARLAEADACTCWQLEQVFEWQINVIHDARVAAGEKSDAVLRSIERELAERGHEVHLVNLAMRPASTRPTVRGQATPREHRRSSATRNKSHGASASDPSRPRKCRGCGIEFTPSAPQQRYHSRDCSDAARQRQLRKRRREASHAKALLDQYRNEVFKARRKNLLTEVEAIELLIEPSDVVLERLAEAAA